MPNQQSNLLKYVSENSSWTESESSKDSSDTYKTLFHEQTEQDGIANLTKWLKHLSSQVRILNHVIQLSQVVAQDTCNDQQWRPWQL